MRTEFYVVVAHSTGALGARGDRCGVVVAADCTGGYTGVLGGVGTLGGDRSCVVVVIDDCTGDCTDVLGGDGARGCDRYCVVDRYCCVVVAVDRYCADCSGARSRAVTT